MEIIPAIIPKDYNDLSSHLKQVKDLVKLAQVDILDGKFVPEASWPYEGDEGEFADIVAGERGFPYWEDINFEVDLMIESPKEVVADWLACGARRIIFHVESNDVHHALNELEKLNPDERSTWHTEIGLAINTTTPNDAVLEHAERIDFVQCMGIAEIGFQGEPFDERVLKKIKDLKKKLKDKPIAVDGSVNLETAPKLIAAGATRLVAGSAIFESENVENSIEEFRNLMVE